jgi:hypothetical protein
MANIRTEQITDFSGGIADDIRQQTTSQFSLSKHFDIFSNPKRLIPYRRFEADTNDGLTSTGMKQYLLTDFLISSYNGALYGLGKKASGLDTKIFKKDAADIITGNWTVGSIEGNKPKYTGAFIEYKDHLLGLQGNGTAEVWKFNLATSTFTNAVAILGSATNEQRLAQPVIGKDDNCYLFYENKVVRVNSSITVTDAVLTLPSSQIITDATNFGNYMAIATTDRQQNRSISSETGKSYVYIWDLVSSDVTEKIDWGEGACMVLGNLDGTLVGVSTLAISSNLGLGRGSIVIREYRGGTAKVVKEIKALNTAGIGNSLRNIKVVQSGRLYFYAKVPNSSVDGTSYIDGIWVWGRKNENYPYALTIDQAISASNSSGVQGFNKFGNTFWVVHSNDGSIIKNDDSANYTETSFIETNKINGGDSSKKKKLLSVAVSYDPLGTSGQVTLKYRVDENTNWTTIFTDDTDNSISKEATKDASGAAFATFKELQFRIESTSGAEITGLKYRYSDMETLIN